MLLQNQKTNHKGVYLSQNVIFIWKLNFPILNLWYKKITYELLNNKFE